MRRNGTMKKRRQREVLFSKATHAHTELLVGSHFAAKKLADLLGRGSAFLMRPRLMERSEHKSAAELILDIFAVKDLTPKSQEVTK